ncbi:MAG: protein BatD [Chlorobi bacterium]|nr:protein BatD [Chlorobiota bacterium]
MKQLIKILFIIIIFATYSCNENEEESSKPENIFEQLTKQPTKQKTSVNKDIKFIASSEKVVEAGEVFQITYKLNDNADNFTPPDLKDFEVLAGPYTSSSSSTSIINGKISRNISNSYTYNVSCQKPGTYTIPPAEVIVDGNTYKSNPLKIKVIGEEINTTQNNVANNNSSKKKKENTPSSDIFIKTTYSKTNLYKGDYIIATTKLYTRKDFQNISEVKFPNYDNFWTEELKAPRQISFRNEEVGGKIYQVALLKQILLFTQNPGNYTISPYVIEVQLKKKDGKARDFFGNIVDHYKLINKRLSTKKQTITVRPLPQPVPENFSGVTGTNIEVETEIDNTNIKTDESANLRITVAGKGNLYLLNELKLQLPEGIEHFKPQVEKTEKYSENGAYSERQFDYIIVGNKPGTHTIKPFEFVYFDTETEQYKTAYGKEIILNVGKGSTYVPTVENSKNSTQKDIRFIKTNNLKLKKAGTGFAGSFAFWLTLASIILLYVIFLIIRKKNIEANKDVVKVKKKNAGKVSQKRLKTALKFMKEGKNQEFYKEILTSIWGYLSDKMSVNSDELTNESIQTLLKERNISEELISKLLNVVELCGYAQYSPAGEEAKPENIYKETESLINELEASL